MNVRHVIHCPSRHLSVLVESGPSVDMDLGIWPLGVMVRRWLGVRVWQSIYIWTESWSCVKRSDPGLGHGFPENSIQLCSNHHALAVGVQNCGSRLVVVVRLGRAYGAIVYIMPQLLLLRLLRFLSLYHYSTVISSICVLLLNLCLRSILRNENGSFILYNQSCDSSRLRRTRTRCAGIGLLDWHLPQSTSSVYVCTGPVLLLTAFPQAHCNRLCYSRRSAKSTQCFSTFLYLSRLSAELRLLILDVVYVYDQNVDHFCIVV